MPLFSKNRPLPKQAGRKILIVLLFLLVCLSIRLRAQDLVWRNYTTKDGLISNEVYTMFMDHKGVMWFGTNLGICKFNGYEFVRPVDTSAFADDGVFYIQEDASGQIWFNRYDQSLWIIRDDTVRAWEHNDLVRPLQREATTESFRFAIDSNGTVLLVRYGFGILSVRTDGVCEKIMPMKGDRIRNLICYKAIGNPLLSFTHSETGKFTNQACFSRIEKGKPLFAVDFVFPNVQKMRHNAFFARKLKNGGYAFFWGGYFFFYTNGQFEHSPYFDGSISDLIVDSTGTIFITQMSGKGKGLLMYENQESLIKGEHQNLMPDHFLSSVMKDKEGGLWVCSRDAGIFYCKNTELYTYDIRHGLPSSKVIALDHDRRETLFAALGNLDLVEIQPNKSVKILRRPPIVELTAMRFDPNRRRLWVGNKLCFWEKEAWKNAIVKNNPQSVVEIKNMHYDPLRLGWWGGTHNNFFFVDSQTGQAEKVNAGRPNLRTFSVTPTSDGKLWVTTLEGLKIWHDGHLSAPPFEHQALKFQARQVEALPAVVGGGVVISLKGGGLLIHNDQGLNTHLSTRNGLCADWFSCMYVDSNGIIYAGANAGMNILTPSPGGGWHIQALNIKHGLPSNQVNDITFFKNEIWVATDQGIAHFRDYLRVTPMQSPQLDAFKVNNTKIPFEQHLPLSYQENNITITYFSLHYRSEGMIPYRYRLSGSDTNFIYSTERQTQLSGLPPGSYVFEVQAQSEDGKWSAPAKWWFRIEPPWWQTWWFYLLVGISIISAGYFMFQRRVRSLQKEALEQEKIRDLEAAALRAQINPHFIFNCLQAIQAFIVKNEQQLASDYLARFARLVRLALHGSIDGRHTLAEEVTMLESYLALEQLRFPGKFEFSIHISEGLQHHDTLIPPLLIQPFVENALIHGLRERETGGLIQINFENKGSDVQICVTDNGVGFSNDYHRLKNDMTHKSVGMMLTQKRLDLLSDGRMNLKETNIYDDNGNILGARVCFEIKTWKE